LRALGYAAAALIGIFLLLQAAVASWRRAGLMMLSLPLSVAGGVLAAPLAGGLWSIGSLAGLLAVLALAIRGSVLLGHRIPGRGNRTAGRGNQVPRQWRRKSRRPGRPPGPHPADDAATNRREPSMLSKRPASLASAAAAIALLTGCSVASAHEDPPPATVKS